MEHSLGDVADDETNQIDEAKRTAVAEGIKAADEGHTVPHEKVKTWLKSWGKKDELPAPE